MMTKQIGKDRLDKYRQHLITGKKLTERHQLYFEKITLAHSLLCASYSDASVVEILRSKYQNIQPYLIIRDSYAVYGDVKEVSKKGRKNVFYETFMRLAKKCEQAGDFEGAGKNYERAAKLYDIFNTDAIPIDISAYNTPVQINFTTNIMALHQQEIEELE